MWDVTFCSAVVTRCTTCFKVHYFRTSPTDFVYYPTNVALQKCFTSQKEHYAVTEKLTIIRELGVRWRRAA